MPVVSNNYETVSLSSCLPDNISDILAVTISFIFVLFLNSAKRIA